MLLVVETIMLSDTGGSGGGEGTRWAGNPAKPEAISGK